MDADNPATAAPHDARVLELRLLGPVEVRAPDGSTLSLQPKRLALLAYLAVATPRGVHRRDTLLALFWPDQDAESARGALRQALKGLRQVLPDGVLVTRGDDVGLDAAALTCDVWAFEEAIERAELERAASFYRAPLLQGFFLSDCSAFEQWVDVERDRSARAYRKVIEQIAERAGRGGDRLAAVSWWRRVSENDPYSTRVALRVMEALEAAGDRAGALQYADEHAARLREELGAEPAPEVVALAERLRAHPARHPSLRTEAERNTVAGDRRERLEAALAGRYRIERELGRGGMATVYLAEDVKHHRPVAVKVLRPELAAAIGPERFLREIEITARLDHPHILPLLDSGETDGCLYYVMPYVEGESLRDRLQREKQLPIEDAIQITREVADALDFAHGHDVVHRDIKPENILLSAGHARVADFGIARAISAAGGGRLTQTGFAVGTPAYMSPEQAAGDSDLDGRSDLYALGCVLYEMLGGEPPFSGVSPQAVLARHGSDPVPNLRTIRTTVPESIVQAIERVLNKSPADRFRTAEEFRDVLGGAALESEPPSFQPTGQHEPVPETAIPVQATRDRGEPTELAEEPVSQIPVRRHKQRLREAAARRRIRVPLVATLSVVVAAVAVLVWRPWEREHGEPSPSLHRHWLMVAEFEGPAEDPTLAVAARALVSAALDQSNVVGAVARDQIALALELAGRPETVTVDEALARELAIRSAVRAVVTGRLDRVGQGYSVVLRVVDAESGETIVSTTGVTENDDGLLEQLPALARQLREGLGERREGIAATRSPRLVSTPSVEAYRRFIAGWEMHERGEYLASVDEFRAAVQIDPGFASAWSALAGARNLAGFHGGDSLARYARAQAGSLRGRLSDLEQLEFEWLYAASLPAKIRALDRIIQRYPGNHRAHVNRAIYVRQLGQFDSALAALDLAATVVPVGLTLQARANRLVMLIQTGKLEEAREYAHTLSGVYAELAAYLIALADADWVKAESVATAVAGNPRRAPRRHFEAALVLASAHAARGRVSAANATLQQVRNDAAAEGRGLHRRHAEAALVLLGMAAERPAETRGEPRPPGAWWFPQEYLDDDMRAACEWGTAWPLLYVGTMAAALGDTALARECLVRLGARPPEEVARAGRRGLVRLLEAWIAMQSRDWRGAVDVLGAVARQGANRDFQFGSLQMRWLVAQAYEQLGRPDSAAAYLELALSVERLESPHIRLRGLHYSFGHRRLAKLYAQLGDDERANEHWLTFIETFTDPDPEYEWMVEEARDELERLARGR